MLTPIASFHAVDRTRALATSALPNAPVVPDTPVAPRNAPVRAGLAAVLRRGADRLAQEPRGAEWSSAG
jgi:hypothetical protein